MAQQFGALVVRKGDLGLLPSTHTAHTYTCRQNIHAHKANKSKNMKSIVCLRAGLLECTFEGSKGGVLFQSPLFMYKSDTSLPGKLYMFTAATNRGERVIQICKIFPVDKYCSYFVFFSAHLFLIHIYIVCLRWSLR